jgi:hypothetical protein
MTLLARVQARDARERIQPALRLRWFSASSRTAARRRAWLRGARRVFLYQQKEA